MALEMNSYITKKRLAAFTFLMLANITYLFSQENNNPIKFSGSASVSDNFYSASGIDPRQPGNLLSFIIQPNKQLFSNLLISLELALD